MDSQTRDLLIFALIGIIAGFLASLVVGGDGIIRYLITGIIGAFVGGYIVTYLDWRLIFYINVPIGLLGAVAAAFILPKMQKAETHRFEHLGDWRDSLSRQLSG